MSASLGYCLELGCCTDIGGMPFLAYSVKKGCGLTSPSSNTVVFKLCFKLFCKSCITYCLSQRVLVKGGAADNSGKPSGSASFPASPTLHCRSVLRLWGPAITATVGSGLGRIPQPLFAFPSNKATFSFFKLCIYVCI